MSTFQKMHLGNFNTCESIVIPVNDLNGHWYMLRIQNIDKYIEIWDSHPSGTCSSNSRVCYVHTLLRSLDLVLAKHISSSYNPHFKFEVLPIKFRYDVATSHNCFYCGVFVCQYMHMASTNSPTYTFHFKEMGRTKFFISLKL
ncbi:hypothetical protein ACOSQ3_031725 [Xanthoceras sorbifolium]